MARIIIGVIVILVIIVVGNIFLPVPRAAISVAAEPIGFLGPFPVTNALFTSVVISVILLIGAFIIGRSLKEVPGGLQNMVELLIESLEKFVNDIAPKKWAPTFFPILATIFIYLLFANWFGLLTPLLGSIGFVHSAHEETVIVPFFRAPSSDLNLTFALALMSVLLTQVFGVWELGPGYFGKFFQFGSFAKKGLGLGLIDFFMGLIELVSEFAKILSFAFRLFGNIFAGEVILIIISSLVSLLLVVIFFGLEIFVGLIQAFVFFILSLVFWSMATQSHGEHSEH